MGQELVVPVSDLPLAQVSKRIILQHFTGVI